MKLVAGLILGIFLTFILIAITVYASVTNGWVPARMDEPAGGFEKWAARTSLHATVRREGTDKSTVAADETNLMAGADVYKNSCAVCHGTPSNAAPPLSKGFAPVPTLFGGGDLVTDDPEGEIYWRILHGIKFTGMPSFKDILSDKERWQVTMFLKNMDKLPPKVDAYWKIMK